jgi:hypothetical protein
MALPSSGPLSISAIRDEEVNNGGFASTYSLYQLSINAGKASPDAISEFYGYSASISVYINVYVPSYVGCYNYYTFAATSSNASNTTAIPVNTNVVVSIGWNGDLGGYFSGQATILQGQSCGSTSTYSGATNCNGEYVSIVNWSMSPNTSGNQNYISNIDYYTAAPC